MCPRPWAAAWIRDHHRLQSASLHHAHLPCVLLHCWLLPQSPADPRCLHFLPVRCPGLSGTVVQSVKHLAVTQRSCQSKDFCFSFVPLKASSMPCTPVLDDSSVSSISASVPTQIRWGKVPPNHYKMIMLAVKWNTFLWWASPLSLYQAPFPGFCLASSANTPGKPVTNHSWKQADKHTPHVRPSLQSRWGDSHCDCRLHCSF